MEKTSMKVNNELISVIIPVYQVEKYLVRCLESVVNQTYKNLEIILVDDGSTDASGEICDEYAEKDDRIKVIHKENGGLSSARNAGLDIAQGEYIAFVDSDDWVTTDYVEYLYEILIRNDADFSMANMMRTTKNTGIAYVPFVGNEIVLNRDDFLKRLFKVETQENVQYACAKLYKKTLFEKIRFPLGLTAEDVPTTFQVALISNKIAYSPKVVYNYYFNPESITGIKWSNSTFDLIKIWDLIYDKAVQNGEKDIIQYAKVNRMRADFGVLFQIARAMPKMDILENRDKIKKIQKDLKANLKWLLLSWIPFSRKTMILCFCISFFFSMIGIRLVSKIMNWN